MANEQNLNIIRDSQRARELQEKSVQKRKENQEKRETFKAMLLLMLDKQNKNGKTKREEINEKILEKAISGDVRAYEVIRDTVGEKPVDKVETSGEQNLDINIKVIDNGA